MYLVVLQAYCEIGVVDSFQGRWDNIGAKVNSSEYSCTANLYGCEIDANTATGDSPKFTAMIKTHHGP